MTLSERLHRPCRTPDCDRLAIRDGAFCSDCTNVVWATGRLPEWRRRAREDVRARGFVASKALDPA